MKSETSPLPARRRLLWPLLLVAVAACPDTSPTPLRVGVRYAEEAFVQRAPQTQVDERARLKRFAAEIGRPLQWVEEPDLERMLAAVAAGRLDLAAANLTRTDARAGRVAFSRPTAVIDEWVVVRRQAPTTDTVIWPPAGLADLGAGQLCVSAGSAHLESLNLRRPADADWSPTLLPAAARFEDRLEALEAGRCEAVVFDANEWLPAAPGLPELVAAFRLAERRPVAIAVRPGRPELLESLNTFLAADDLGAHDRAVDTGDLDAVRHRGRLRVLTRNSEQTWFLHRGEAMGFEYEMMRRFAEQLGVGVEFIVPPDDAALEDGLLAGHGDIVAALMLVTPERAARLRFSRPYLEVRQWAVGPLLANAPTRPTDLGGRRLRVPSGTAEAERARELAAAAPGLRLELAPAGTGMQRLLDELAGGARWFTLSSDLRVRHHPAWGRAVTDWVDLGAASVAWAVRPGNPALAHELDRFHRRVWRGLEFNMMRQRFLDPPSRSSPEAGEVRPDAAGQLSDWDAVFRAAAAEHGLDWRLLAAMAFQESRFDPSRRSWMGAEGLMQLMPRTAASLGVTDPWDPAQSIRGGAAYLARMLERFDERLPWAERLAFALASYNAGYSHVQDARRVARRLGLDPDRWMGQVEQAMLRLEDPAVYRTTRFGYARGSETVRYVLEILERHRVYVAALPLERGLPVGGGP